MSTIDRTGFSNSTSVASVPRTQGTSKYIPSFRPYAQVGKRLFDLILAFLLLPALLPAIILLGLITKLDGGPALFGHYRVGRHGKPFRCLKIRSMVVDSQAELEKYLSENPHAAEEWRRDQKLTNDPRITKFGKFIRATSLDELPQIWNVLKGEMSFVGPRPVIRDELLRYGRRRRAYIAMRPGLTGVWQVSGRNDVSYEDRINMDVSYYEHVSLPYDVGILLKTVKAVLGRTGR